MLGFQEVKPAETILPPPIAPAINPITIEKTADGWKVTAIGLPVAGIGSTEESAEQDFLDNLDDWIDGEVEGGNENTLTEGKNEAAYLSWFAQYEVVLRSFVKEEPEEPAHADDSPQPKVIRRPFNKRSKKWRGRRPMRPPQSSATPGAPQHSLATSRNAD